VLRTLASLISVLRTHRGNTIGLAGKKLKDILPHLKREVIDVEVDVSFKGGALLDSMTLTKIWGKYCSIVKFRAKNLPQSG